MTKPHFIRLDCEAEAGYIYYSKASVAGTRDVWKDGQVAADYDAEGEIIGIEILGFDEATLREAKRFANSNDLAFPPNLRGSLVLSA